MKKILLTAVAALMFGTAIAQGTAESKSVARSKTTTSTVASAQPQTALKAKLTEKTLDPGKLVKKGTVVKKQLDPKAAVVQRATKTKNSKYGLKTFNAADVKNARVVSNTGAKKTPNFASKKLNAANVTTVNYAANSAFATSQRTVTTLKNLNGLQIANLQAKGLKPSAIANPFAMAHGAVATPANMSQNFAHNFQVAEKVLDIKNAAKCSSARLAGAKLKYSAAQKKDMRKAGSDDEYVTTKQHNASGIDAFTEKNVSWIAEVGVYYYSGQALDVMVDPIPSPFNDGGIAVFYKKSGNNVIIPAQPVAELQDGTFLTLFGTNKEDGSIELTMASDGSLHTIAGQEIAYGIFSTEDFDPTFSSFEEAVEVIDNVSYSGNNGNTGGNEEHYDCGIEGVDAKYKYNATGVDYQSGSKLSWDAYLGTYEYNSTTYDVFINVIPTPESFGNFGPVMLAAQIEGDELIIPAQYFAKDGNNYVFAFCANYEDNAIHMKIAADGSLSIPSTDEIIYAAFTSEEIAPDYSNFAGSYCIIQNVKYSKVNSGNGGGENTWVEDSGIDGYSTTYKYDAKGYDPQEGTLSRAWTARLGVYEGQNLSIDLVENPFVQSGIDVVPIAYQVSGTKATFSTEIVVSGTYQGSPLYIRPINITSSTTAEPISLTLTSDGKLTAAEGSFLAYGAFTTEDWDGKTLGDNFLGYWDGVGDPSYKLVGGTGYNGGGNGGTWTEDSGIDGYSTTYKYDAKGYDPQEGTLSRAWTARLGVYEGQNLSIDLVENPFVQSGIDVVPIAYQVSGTKATFSSEIVVSGTYQGSPLYIRPINITSNSTAEPISLTLTSDGKLSAPEGSFLAYGAFTTEDWDGQTLSDNNFLGYWDGVGDPSYKLVGGTGYNGGGNSGSTWTEDSGIDGYSTKYRYAAKGYDPQEGTLSRSWTARLGEIEGMDMSIDLVENPFVQSGVDFVPLPYTVSGNKVTFSDDVVVEGTYQGSPLLIRVLNITSNTTAEPVTLTLSSDGKLTVPADAFLIYAAFTSEEWDGKTIGDNFLGYWDGVGEPTYTLNGGYGYTNGGGGQETPGGPDLDGFTTTYAYDAVGGDYDFSTQKAYEVTWDAYVGQYQGIDCIVDIIPNPFSSSFPCVPLQFVKSGNNIVVPAQVFAESQDGYVMVHSESTEDGSIIMTLDNDGNLALADPEDAIGYSVFTTEEFSEDSYVGSYCIVIAPQYTKKGATPGPGPDDPTPGKAPNVMYEPESLALWLNYSPTFYASSNTLAMLPAYADMKYTNYTKDKAQGFIWSVSELEYSATRGEYVSVNEQVGTERDFVQKTEGGKIYGPVSLVGYNGEKESEAYKYGLHWDVTNDQFYALAGANGAEYEVADGTQLLASRACKDNDITLYGFLGTPGVNNSQYDLSSIILYQGKPAAPLYFEGISLWVYQPEVSENFNLTCEIRKCHRDEKGQLEIGDVIATSISKYDDFKIYPSSGTGLINFNRFYTYDIDGLTIGHNHLFVEDEFLVFIKGWNNGTFETMPVGEYEMNDNGVTSVFIQQKGDDNVYGFNSLYGKVYLNFTNACYGYLHTEEPTTMAIPAQGGKASISVKPMLYTIQSNGAPATRLELDAEYELPAWLSYSFENENYVGEDNYSFDLVFQAEALPTDVQSRSAELKFWQEGAILTVKVTQSADNNAPLVDGIVEVTTEAAPFAGSNSYNVAGQKVANNFKGILIKGGKKLINK